ncbi:copia protein [Tanacetum coccineum]
MGVNVLVYANSDHVSDVVDRKSTSGICTFVGSCLTSWFLKKQRSRTKSITESDYVAAKRACQQALWMKQAFVDYNLTIDKHPPYKFKWTERTIPVAKDSSETTTEGYMENYKNVSEDIRNLLNAEAKAVHIILTEIENDIYSTVDACQNVIKFTSRDGESLEPYYLRFYKMMNKLVRNKCKVTNHQMNVQFLLQLQPEWQRRKEIDKTDGLISLSFKKIYKPTNNNFRTSSNTSRANQDNTLRINRGTGYDN